MIYNNQPLFIDYDVISFGQIEDSTNNVKENILLMYATKYIYNGKIQESHCLYFISTMLLLVS